MIKIKYLFLLLILFFSFQPNTWGENILTEFLIANPYMQDSRFKETVIVIIYHNFEEGAAGLVINKPIKTISISELFKGTNLTPPEHIVKKEITLYWGGPVESEHLFIFHSSDYKSDDFILSNKDFTVTRAPEILYDIAENKGPKEYKIFLGIAIWRPGQLDSEMARGDWDKRLNNNTSLFDNGNQMWSRLITSQDI